MAEHRIAAKSMTLKLRPVGDPTLMAVVCLTEITRSDTRTVTDASSFCGPNKSMGPLEVGERTFQGFHLMDPDNGKVSAPNIREWLYNGTTLDFTIGPLAPENGDELETGTCFISNLSDTYGNDSDATFSGAIQPYGTPVFTIETS